MPATGSTENSVRFGGFGVAGVPDAELGGAGLDVSGEVVESNDALSSAPETVNADPEGAGWFGKIKVKDPSQLDALMDRAAYDQYLTTL